MISWGTVLLDILDPAAVEFVEACFRSVLFTNSEFGSFLVESLFICFR